MRHIKVRNLDTTDVEEGSAVRSDCYNCRAKQAILVRVIRGEFGTTKTRNKIGVCTNKDCFRYSEFKDSQNWIKDDIVV
jgi:hypothetical protein